MECVEILGKVSFRANSIILYQSASWSLFFVLFFEIFLSSLLAWELMRHILNKKKAFVLLTLKIKNRLFTVKFALWFWQMRFYTCIKHFEYNQTVYMWRLVKQETRRWLLNGLGYMHQMHTSEYCNCHILLLPAVAYFTLPVGSVIDNLIYLNICISRNCYIYIYTPCYSHDACVALK